MARDNKDIPPNAVLFAGLKWFDNLMELQKQVTYCAQAQNVQAWHIALSTYISLTKRFMSETDKTAIMTDSLALRSKVVNFLHYGEKLGQRRQSIHNSLCLDLLGLQTKVFDATAHLDLKTSAAQTGEIDFTKESRGE